MYKIYIVFMEYGFVVIIQINKSKIKNQLHAVSRTQQGRQREPSVK